MKRLLSILLFLAPCTLLGAQSRLSQYANELDAILVEPGEFAPLPRADAAFWRDSVPESMRRSYVEFGEQYLGKPWPALPATLFAQFKETGNRVNYETACFERRRQLGALVMAEVSEGQGRFVGDIIDGLQALCEETWWGLPAHYGSKVPRPDDQNVDLFNAETASLVVWTRYVMQPWLDRFSPLVAQRVDNEIGRRILEPARQGNYWWKKAGMNWNPWICSNWLACVLLCETDRQRQLDAVAQILRATDAFIDAYKPDGGCDEGPGYWDRAAASMYEILNLLRLATGGHIDLSRDPKVQAMGSYVYKTYIGNGYVLNFADSHENRSMQQVNIVYPFGRYLADPVMTRFARYIGDSRDLMHHAALLYERSGNFPTLGRELFFLSDIGAYLVETPQEPQLPAVWLPDLQIWAGAMGREQARVSGLSRRDRSGVGLYVALKGGTNGESHNHNDVGQLVVYADGEPLLVDPGVGEYTAKTFSAERYTIWTMQSGYHNVPQINGTDQHDGPEYGARVVSQSPRRLVLDIAGAYPPDAGVRTWQRSVELAKQGTVLVEERYELTEHRQPTRLMFMTVVEPSVPRPGCVALGSHSISYNPAQLSVAVEDVSPMLDPLLRGMWGEHMWRIVLTVRSEALTGRIRYSITP